jgi:hypothetical protein
MMMARPGLEPGDTTISGVERQPRTALKTLQRRQIERDASARTMFAFCDLFSGFWALAGA